MRSTRCVGVLAVILGVACRQPSDVQTRPAREPSASPVVTTDWFDLGVPRAGLVRVLPESNEHGFYADYSGKDRNALLDEVSRALAKAGYSPSCTAVDGLVLGFSNGRRQLALKIDTLPYLSLSLFDEQGKDPILHGLCFGRYRAGARHTLSKEEKEALARKLEAEESGPATPAPSGKR